MAASRIRSRVLGSGCTARKRRRRPYHLVDKMPVISDALAGKRIGVTGATGFLGTAIVAPLLRAVPGCEVVLLVRPGRRATGADRVKREILRNDCFDRLRRELG